MSIWKFEVSCHVMWLVQDVQYAVWSNAKLNCVFLLINSATEAQPF